MWQTLIWTISLPAQALIGGAVIWLYNLATGNSLSEFIGMIVTHGYTQGPGQAYAFGTLWEKGGIADCATVGVIYAALGFLSAAIVGVPVARWFVRKGLNANKTGASITKEFLTGIMDEKSTATNGRETTHASTIDTLAFHVALVGIVYLITYAELSWLETHIKPFFDQYKWLKGFGATLSMPMFFIHGLIVAWLLRTLLLKLGAGSGTGCTQHEAALADNYALMAFALAQNIRQNIYIAVCTLLHLHYLHPHTVGHLVTQQLKQLFSIISDARKRSG